jgi:VanZ family protein
MLFQYKPINKAILFRLILIVWFISIGIVSYLSIIPKLELPFGFKWDDKIHHFLAYLWLSAPPLIGFRRLKLGLTGAALMIPLGIGLEIAQNFIPGRFFSIFDMIVNTIGVFCGLFLVKYLRHTRSKKALTPPTRHQS